MSANDYCSTLPSSIASLLDLEKVRLAPWCGSTVYPLHEYWKYRRYCLPLQRFRVPPAIWTR
ncbi:hypothetical protein HMPREF3185_01723 [Porphyromonas somerae]|uniref:Uncharacterized protein n=1 Tax=Porphyromonas somerae TaxID=322095 RepID=A0A134B3A0_9PORP|nr:hypothetical protein HMPREF3184_01723 [Porphyromonadaceae bacterium KA00676]KXB74414.1 hypothetical protein HMPREF3185_01723 [Porphyromonas somerae]